MFDDVKDLKIEIQKNDEGEIAKIIAGESTYNSVDEAAKGLAEKDAFITQLKAENSEYRGQLREREDTSSLLKKLQDQVGSRVPHSDPLGDDLGTFQGDTVPSMTKEEVAALTARMVEDRITKLNEDQSITSREERVQDNTQRIQKELEEHYGSKLAAKEAFDAYTSSSSYNKDIFGTMLADTPDAIMTTVKGLTPKKDPVEYGMSTRSSSSQSQGTGGRDWSHYAKMLRENPKKYYDVATQREIRQQISGDEKFAAQVTKAALSK